jgi:hypothetical protein
MAGYLNLESSSPPDTSGTPKTGGARREFNKDAKMNNCVPAKGAMKKLADKPRDIYKEKEL